jgi:hypothetical protein
MAGFRKYGQFSKPPTFALPASLNPSGSLLLAERYHRADMLQPIPPEALPAFHDTPVFSSRYGWAMVNAIEGELFFASGMRLSLADVTEVYVCLRPLQHPARQYPCR